ncbi:PASTA domain-containing protein [Nonomuraea sp. NPDC049419]|uniref:PASTA domain-containing protein n=1 Tax=Nonomuraea sp. NPDC049419 TaxID=3155772 RepID=UPI00342D1E56
MPTAQPLRTGDPRRLGDYELTGRLGEGGQGAVFLGSRSGETYAVKLLHGPVGDERAAFLREVELAKHVARFCTAQVIDAGFDEGRPYIVSEYVDGHSLAREVALTGPRRGGALERLAVGTATALAAIHRAGIVHRDFKPQNVLLGSDGPRVIDFGLARALDAAATVSGRGVGTPAYMAPEQITASAVTGAADVFSWGATMCFAANASAPFGQDSVAPVLHRILTAPPELGLLDGRLRTLVAACLDKDARNRPSSRELLFELLGADGPAEVLRSPPPPIPRTPPTPLVPGQRTPDAHSGPTAAGGSAASRGPSGVSPGPAGASPGFWFTPLADPEATGAMDAYHLPPATSGPQAAQPAAGAPQRGADIGEALPGDPSQAGEGRTDRRQWPRAAVAVCAALLVTAVVLLAVVVPALTQSPAGHAGPQAGGPLASPPPVTPAPETTRESPAEAAPTKTAEARQSQDDRRPAYDPPAVVRPPTVTIPPLTGLDKAAATKAVERAGLTLGRVTRQDSPRAIGQVLASTPAAGTAVDRGAKVSLRVSAGLPVPEVTGMRRGPAEAALTGAGLKVGAITRSCSQEPSGQVLSTRPKAGSRVKGGTAVALTVSRNGATVPPVVGRSREAARTALTAAGFTVGTKEQLVDDESQAGAVLAQSIDPGTCAEPGAQITITVGLAAQTGPDPGESLEPTTNEPEPEQPHSP